MKKIILGVSAIILVASSVFAVVNYNNSGCKEFVCAKDKACCRETSCTTEKDCCKEKEVCCFTGSECCEK